jgi:hypothetical protein
MLRRFLPLVALAAAVAAPRVAVTLSAGSGSAAPGGSVEIALTLKAEGVQTAGVNFDILYDSSALEITAKEGPTARAAGKSLYSNQLSPGKVRYLVAGISQKTLENGVVVLLSARVKPNASGSYTLRLTNLACVDKSAKSVPIKGVDGTVTARI